MAQFTVAVYLIDKAYGGSEEGGWWYTYGDLADEYPERPCQNLQHANRVAAELNAELERTVNAGRPSISSMASQGRYEAQVHEGQPPAHFPAERPHYE